MKFLLFITTLVLCWVSLDAFSMEIGSRKPGDKLLYSYRLSAGPFTDPRNITLTFEYRTDDLIFKREYLTQMAFSRPDDEYPNSFGSMFLNSTFLYMTPVRQGVKEWWLLGNLYGFDEEPSPKGELVNLANKWLVWPGG